MKSSCNNLFLLFLVLFGRMLVIKMKCIEDNSGILTNVLMRIIPAGYKEDSL